MDLVDQEEESATNFKLAKCLGHNTVLPDLKKDSTAESIGRPTAHLQTTILSDVYGRILFFVPNPDSQPYRFGDKSCCLPLPRSPILSAANRLITKPNRPAASKLPSQLCYSLKERTSPAFRAAWINGKTKKFKTNPACC